MEEIQEQKKLNDDDTAHDEKSAAPECPSCKELKAGWQRAVADYQNLKREVEQKRAEWFEEAKMRVVERFLPGFANLGKALAHRPLQGDGSWMGWAKGCEQVLRQFEEVLRSLEVERIKTEGAQFDPTLHEAVGYEEDPHRAEEEIIKEVEAGFMIGNRTIKPAKVIVARTSSMPVN